MTNNVTLRGAGADQTLIVVTGGAGVGLCGTVSVCMSTTDNNAKGSPANLANWTAGYTKGTTTITLSSVPNLKVGSLVILDQLNSTQDDGSILVTDSTTQFPFTAPGIAGPYSFQGNSGGAQRTGRQQQQFVTVTAISGNQVTISPGLYMPNWSAASTPQAWWPTNPALGQGLENLTVDSTGNSQAVGIQIRDCLNCYVKGVRGIDSARSQVQVYNSAHSTVRDSYFFLTQNQATASYGWECYSASDNLAENNIFQAVVSPEMFNSACSGSVVGYNFSINNYYPASPGYNANAHGDHTSGVDDDLYEGNVGNIVNADVVHGTHNLMTYYRNRLSGQQPGGCYASGSSYATAVYAPCSNNVEPIALQSFSRFYNVIGNVLGTSGTNTTYINGANVNLNGIYALGGGNAQATPVIPDDPNVQPTTMLWGNYDTANAAVRFVASEVPSALTGTQAPFANPVPASQTLPASFYYSGTPAWWPAGKPWPPIGPDVTGGNISGVAGHANTIPAQDCYTKIGGNAGGTSGVLTFNAALCYGTNTTPPPPPPTGTSCDLNGDGSVNVLDVQRCVNQALGVASCTNGDVNSDGSCNVLDVQKVVNGALGGTCP